MNPVGSLEDDSSRFGRLIDRFLPDDFDDETEQLFRARVVVACSFAIAIFGPVYAALLYALTGSIPQVVATMVATTGVVATPWLMRRGISFPVLGNWMTVCGCALFTYVATQSLGPSVLMWQVVFVILVALIAGRASALGWVAVMSTTTIYFYMSMVQTAPDEGATISQTQLLWEMSLTVGMFVAVLVLTLTYEALKDWALERFRKREYHTRAMLQAAPDGVVTLTPDGRIADMNAAAQELFDHARETARLAPVTTLIPEIEEAPPEPAEEYAPADGEVFREPEDRQDDLPGGIAAWTGDTYEVEAVRHDGSRFPAELSVSQIDDGRFVMIVRDVTDWKDTQEKLRLARDQAVQANEAKSRFLANISHELRTPLNAIIGYSELVTEDLKGTEQDGLVPDLERIHKAGEHLLSLINDILDLSKVEAGKMDLHLEQVDIPDLVDEVTGTVEPLIAENQNTLRVDIAEAPETMYVDRQKLRQMLLNLLSNAAKFTENSLVRIHAFAETQDGVDCCVFEVIDRGVGIPEEDLEELFEAFSQADESSTREHEGTGLGLTITKRFTEMMKGDIDVESQLGEGSTFRITLPVDVEAPGGDLTTGPAEETETSASDAAEENDDEHPTPPPNAPEVLVIDDDPTVHELMERFLTREGFAVETAQGGEQGLTKARELDPDVITLDVLMPQVDGWSILERLKDDDQLADIPVVMVTIIGDKNMGFSLGASDYLTKPVDRGRLADVLADHAGAPDSQPVLIAEDDADTRELLERTVERSGWKALSAENGREALEKIDNGVDPQAILLDLMMPELDGFELLDEIRNRPEYDDLPVIVVSAADLSESERRQLDANADRILQKGEHAREQLIEELNEALDAPPPQTAAQH